MTINYWENRKNAENVQSDGLSFIFYAQKEIYDVSKILENIVNNSNGNKYDKYMIDTYTNFIEQCQKAIDDKRSEIALTNNAVWYNTAREKDLKKQRFDHA